MRFLKVVKNDICDVKADVKQQEENWWNSCIFYFFMRSTLKI